MTKRTHLALLCAVVIIGLLIPPVLAGEASPEAGDYFYRPFDYAQDHPDIDGDIIVWEDSRNDNLKDIYFGTVDRFRDSPGYTGERITSDPAFQKRPSISGDYIVWQGNQSGNWDIYLYERSSKTAEKLTDDPGDQRLPAIHGDYIAWYDDSSGKTEIVLYDIAAGDVKDTIKCDARTTIPFGKTEFKPALSDKYVAWVDKASERVHYYDIVAGVERGTASTNVARQSWPSLYGSLIVWEDYRAGTENSDIYMRDLDDPSSEDRQITYNSSDQASPAMYENIIVWEDTRSVPRGIYMYDLDHKEEIPVYLSDDDTDEHLYPVVSGNTIVWQRGASPNSNLYIFIYNPEAVEPTLASIEVTPATPTVEIGGEVGFTAICYDQSDNTMTGIDIDWTSSDTTVGTIDQTGTFTALAEGTADITATAGDIFGTATVTVTTQAPPEAVLTGIEVTPATPTVEIGGEVGFTAICYDQSGNAMMGIDIDWTSSDTTVGTIDQTGTFTALAEGAADITATAGDIFGTATVTVTAQAPPEAVLTGIEISPTAATAVVGKTVGFKATARDQSGNAMAGVDITWTSSDTTVGTIDQAGTFTALTEGVTTIAATAGELSAEASVTVTAEEPVPVPASLKLTPPGATLYIGDDQKFTVTAFDQKNNAVPTGEVTWTNSDETVGTISAAGIFTAHATGTTTITAKAGDLSADATITVNAPAPALGRVVVSPSAVTLGIGDSLQFDSITFDPFGNIVSDAEVTWDTSDCTMGTISDTGCFTAGAEGIVTICAIGDGATGTATVTVTSGDPVITRIVVTPAAMTLHAGDEETLIATVYDQYGQEIPGVEVTWESSDDTIGAIEDGHFTAFAAGTTTITASAGCCTPPGMATMVVTSTHEDLFDTVVISPAAITLNAGETWGFIATVFDPEGNIIPGAMVDWESSDGGAGIIDGDGYFTALGEGTATITASVEGISDAGTTEVTVRSTDPAPAWIAVSPSRFSIAAGQSLEITATTFDLYGHAMPEVEVAWESDDDVIGAITGCGLFTALADGEVSIRASTGDISGSACGTVEPSIAVPTSIAVEPVAVTLCVGAVQEFAAVVFDQCDDEMDWVRVIWSCSNPCIGTLDRAGLFAALAEGSADVIARAGGVEGIAAVTTATGSPTDPTPTPTDPGNSGGSTHYSGGGGGGDAGPIFETGACENLRSGETFTFSNISVSSVSSVAITAANTIPRMMVTVRESACPNAASPPADDVYEYFDISLYWANPNNIGSALVFFTISADWLEARGISPDDVELMHYTNGAWEALETDFIDEWDGKYHFRATTRGFSTFAIAAAASENETTGEATNTTAEGETNTTVEEETDVTTSATTATTTEVTTAPAAPLIYAPLFAPLVILLWLRRRR